MTVANNSIVHETLASLDISDRATVQRLEDVLDEHSKSLAADEQLRRKIGNGTPDIWHGLRRLWTVVADSVCAIEDDDAESEDGAAAGLRSLCVSVAKFTRNLVAAVPENQLRAYENEPSIRKLLHHYTSYAQVQKTGTSAVTRMLIQALSNIVTANEPLLDKLWNHYLLLPEERFILIRLISTPDAGTALASFVLILNCLYGSQPRLNSLTKRPNGSRLCVTYLDRMASLFDAADEESVRAFDIGYRIFSYWAEAGHLPSIYAQIGIIDEVVTPHQTTLLKLLDAYLQPSNLGSSSVPEESLLQLCNLMTTAFFTLAEYAQHSIRRALGSYKRRSTPLHADPVEDTDTSFGVSSNGEGHQPLAEIDLLLPKVCEALVLVTQCLVSLGLFSEEERDFMNLAPGQKGSPSSPTTNFTDCINNAVSSSGVGSVEALVETLRLLDRFLPRITLGKVAPPPVHVGQSHVPSSDNSVGKQSNSSHPQAADPKGFAYLKRDLVRLLGILVADRRPVQDRVRICEGIPVVLNLCVIDDRNPYLREHAILTLRNLLHGNSENQAVVNAIQPLRDWENSVAG